jgi:hypothetical protein
MKHTLALVMFCCALAQADVVIEDFNDTAKGQTTLGKKLGPAAKASFWYGYNDENHGAAGLGTNIIPDIVNDDKGFRKAIVDNCGNGSPCLHIKFIGGTGYAYPFSAVGFNFLTEGTDIDLSTMTSISFKIKGKGLFRFKLPTKHITDDFDKSNYWADMGTTINLPSTWQSYNMTTSRIAPQSGAPLADTVSWEECMNHTRKIVLATSPTFKAHDTVDLWIDDIVMHGVTPKTFGGSWNEDSAAAISRHSVPTLPARIEQSHDRVRWTGERLVRFELLSHSGQILQPADPVEETLSLLGLQPGTYLVRATTVTGRTIAQRIAWLPEL